MLTAHSSLTVMKELLGAGGKSTVLATAAEMGCDETISFVDRWTLAGSDPGLASNVVR